MRLILLASALCLTIAGCSRPEGSREIVLEARGMRFVVPDEDDTVNPLLRVHPGERIELTLRNQAPGLMHDFRIPDWDVQTEQIRSGESATVSFTVPPQAGRYKNGCGPHAAML